MTKVEQKREEYKHYINKHQANVWRAWIHNMDSLMDYFRLDNIRDIQKIIIEHDDSKYSEEEFEPYRKQFFPTDEAEKAGNKEGFNMAWEHHYKNNPHHWDHWLNENGTVGEMDDLNIIHMICDWMAMGMQFGNTAAEYYEKNKDNIKLGTNTRIKVEAYLAKTGGTIK